MTCRQKLAIEKPDNVNEKVPGGCVGCPDNYGYMDAPKYCGEGNEACKKCWDREISETATATVHTNVYDGQGIEICQSCILCGESIPCGGPMICDSCRDMWMKLKAFIR